MSGFSVRASLVELDGDKFIEAVKTSCREALIKAARKFLLAALPKIPIFTGFARGAFGPLEDVVGRFNAGGAKTGSSINAKAKGHTKATTSIATRPYYYYPKKGERIVRTSISGRPFATQSTDIFSQGRATVATGQSAIFFRFSIDIDYLTYLDQNKWHAFEAGHAAFSAELKTQLDVLLPTIGKYLIRKDVK